MYSIERKKISLNYGSRVIFCFLLLIVNVSYGQIFKRFSDDKQFTSLIISNPKRSAIIDRNNFRSFIFQDDDKLILDNKVLDFSVSGDTLYVFDKVKELEEVKILKENFESKNESVVKSTKNNAYADLGSNNRTATLIKIASRKKTFIKSIILFPKDINSPSGTLEIQLLNNINGLPDSTSPILTFEKDFSAITPKKWEIKFPRPVRYPEDGMFIVFYHHAEQKKWNAILRLNADSHMYMLYPKSSEWKRLSFNSYLYKLRILQ